MSEGYLRREGWFVRSILFCCATSLSHFVHIAWIQYLSTLTVTPPSSFLQEPNFRIGMPFVLSCVSHVFHPQDGTLLLALSDYICALLAFNLLYSLAASGVPTNTGSTNRLLVVCAFLVFLQFPIAFVVPWQRSETLPSTLFLAFALVCLQRVQRSWLWTAALLVAATLQTFVRPDIALAFGVTLLLVSFAGNTLKEFGGRSANVVRALVILAVSGSYQFYMQFVKYRNFPYQKGGPILDNLSPHILSVFLVAMLPFFFAAFLLWRQPRRLTAVETMAACFAVVYFPLYFCLGVIGEVRIYVPALFCLCIVAARSAASYLLARDVMETPAAV